MGATTTLDLQPSEFCFPMKWLLPCLHHASMSLTASCWGTIQMKIVWPSGNMVPIWTLGQNTRSIPIISDGNWEKLIGIHIHGDGCEFYKEDEYFVWSWSSKFLHWRIHQGRSHESFPHRCDSWKMDEKISCYSPCLRFCVLYMTRNRKDRLYPATFFPAPKPQVRDEVHKRIAELTAWSMDFAGQGKWPHNGFQGEAFSAGTTRFKQKGKELAKGWRIPSPYLLQNLSVLLSSKCNGSFDVGIHGEPS